MKGNKKNGRKVRRKKCNKDGWGEDNMRKRRKERRKYKRKK